MWLQPPRSEDARQGRPSRSGPLLAAALAIALVGAPGYGLEPELPKRVSGNLVFWDQARGFDSIEANADVLTEVSPFWYRVVEDGRVEPYTTAWGASYEDPAIVSFLHAHGILVIPTVANVINGTWDGPTVSRIIRDPVLASTNIDALLQLTLAHGYDGIDLDYEDLAAADREAFSTFVSQLASVLHGHGKLLTVNVYAKTSEPGTWAGPQAQDWRAIARAADQVRVMAYEYHWAGSGPGPIAPVAWVRDVLAFARSVIPAGKIMHGLPLYGYDWVGQSGADRVWEESMALASRHGAAIKWDAASASPWFEYMDGTTRHAVWFENAASMDAKLQASVSNGVGGVALWRLGGEDPAVWAALRARLGVADRDAPGALPASSGPAPDTTPPSIVITSPPDGGSVARKVTIAVEAHDDRAVERVEVFVDGRLVATVSTAPYTASWNAQPASRGAHTIRAVAYDRAGNARTSSITVYR